MEEDTNGSNRNSPTVPADLDVEEDANGSNRNSPTLPTNPDMKDCNGWYPKSPYIVEPCAAPAPSYRDGGPQKKCEFHGNFFVIRPKTSSTRTIFQVESNEKIPEEEAICRFCHDTFKGENVLMLTCKCNKKTLAHEACSNQNNNNCEACEEEFQKSLVTLHLEPSSNHLGKTETKKGSFLSRLWRILLCSS